VGDPHALGAADTVPQPLPEKDVVSLAHVEAVGLTLALDDGTPVAVAHLVAETVTLLVGEPLGLPLADAHTVAQALAEAERVAEAHTVNDPEAHGEPEEDRQRDAVGLTLELRE
jgi:hypothetical protein